MTCKQKKQFTFSLDPGDEEDSYDEQGIEKEEKSMLACLCRLPLQYNVGNTCQTTPPYQPLQQP
jgi:hypothetical protein